MVHLIPDLTGEGVSNGFFALFNDISHISSRQTETLQPVLSVSDPARLHALSEMLAEISHALNQPLTAISNYNRAGLRQCGKRELAAGEITALLNNINIEVERAVSIINHIRGFSRKRSVRMEIVSINRLIKRALKIAADDICWHGIGLTTNLQTSGTLINVDRHLMQQVILNILRNAIEALALSGREGREIVVVSCTSQYGVQVSISNNGPELGVADSNRIFEPFFTTKPQGLGIGLSTARSVVASFNGKIGVSQDFRDGVTFNIQLPAWR